MTFTISGNTKQYGPERWEFTPVSDDKKNPKAVRVTRWVTAPNEGWYVIWQGYHFLGNARIMWRDRIAQGWAAS